MAEFYSARSWEIPPLPWTNLSPPFSGITAFENLDRSQYQGGERPRAVTRRQPSPNSHPIPDIPIPPDCREMIRRGALLAVNCSSGKDSQCMTILLSRIVPREQMIVVHAPLAEFEWPRTILRHNHHHDAVKQQLDRWMKEAKGGQQ